MTVTVPLFRIIMRQSAKLENSVEGCQKRCASSRLQLSRCRSGSFNPTTAFPCDVLTMKRVVRSLSWRKDGNNTENQGSTPRRPMPTYANDANVTYGREPHLKSSGSHSLMKESGWNIRTCAALEKKGSWKMRQNARLKNTHTYVPNMLFSYLYIF